MNTPRFVKYAGALIALAMCSACGGSTGVPSTSAVSSAYIGQPLPRYATIAPGQHAQNTYEYVINAYGSYATMFDYPKGDHQVGTINNVGGQGCTNVLYGYGKKTFWIVAGADQITEFEVPKKPIKTLSDSVGAPSSCAMDAGGDLAVGILNGSGAGDVDIFKHATGHGTIIKTPLADEYFDGYDNHGNLFADGFNNSKAFALVELRKGSTKFQTITTSNSVQFPGSVQWDGKYLAVTDQVANEMFRYTISGTKATLEGIVHLLNAYDCAQTWIGKGVVFCADTGDNDGRVFSYPGGGYAIALLTGNFVFPLGVVAAEK
jgi:hypothetical protein